MRILYFHQHFSTPQGSTGTRSYEMACKLAQRGHDVTVVCGSGTFAATGLEGPFVGGRREGQVSGFRVIELELPYANHYGFIRRTIVFTKFALQSIIIALRDSPDLVFATSTPLTAGIPGIFSRWLKRTPFVFEVRDLWPELPREMGVIKNPVILLLMGWLEFVSYHSANRCIGLAPGIVEGIVRRGIPREKVAMIPNGCDLYLFDSAEYPQDRSHLPESLRGDVFVAAYTGTHGIANGLDAVLDALAELKGRGRTDIYVVFVGDGRLKAELQERAEREDLNAIYLESIPKEEVAALLANVDAGLMVLADVPAFYHGTSPNKFFDYIAASLPVITNYPGWLAEMIEEYECGIAVPPQGPSAFADALQVLADNRATARTMGLRARALAEERFSRDVLAEDFVAVIESIGSQ